MMPKKQVILYEVQCATVTDYIEELLHNSPFARQTALQTISDTQKWYKNQYDGRKMTVCTKLEIEFQFVFPVGSPSQTHV